MQLRHPPSTPVTPSTCIPASVLQAWNEDIERARVSLGAQGMAVAVVHRGKIIYAKGFGKRNDVDPFTPETLMPIASITKSFTAAAVGEMVGDNKAKWEGVPVSEYLPEFQLKDPVLTKELTFIDMLSHRTGLPALDMYWYHRLEPRTELVKEMRHFNAEAPLRSKYIYSNIVISVAGEAAARIAGTTYDQLVLDRVVRPVGMMETGLSNETLQTRPNHALPYMCSSFKDAQMGRNYRIPLDTLPKSDAPAGILHSNVIELANWARVMMNDGELDGQQVLNKESIQTIKTPWIISERTPRGPEFSVGAYGLCWHIEHYKGHLTISHGGLNPGYNSQLSLFPNDDFAVIALTNDAFSCLPTWLPYYFADQVLELPRTRDWLFDVAITDTKEDYAEAGLAPDSSPSYLPPQIEDKPTTRPLIEFAGEYTHPAAGKMIIGAPKEDDDGEYKDAAGSKHCHLKFSLNATQGKLRHYHYDTFIYSNIARDAVSVVLIVTFLPGDDGSIQQCRVYNEPDPIIFTRTASKSTNGPK